ncbi:MAG: S8 family peptidase [Patescibacteria group bacterium]|jgi:hypothetical protein|nr:S8 family peptidase [Patescibacteria group bacterium]
MNKKIAIFLILTFLIGSSTSAAFKPNDSFYNNQWYLSKIEADKAWDSINSSPDIIIAVIDSGVDIDHEDLKDNIWQNEKEIEDNKIDDDNNGFIDDVNGWDFVNNNPDPRPKFNENWTESGISHGTVVSGIIAATGDNNQGISGITWDAQIMPLKAISDKGEGKISDIIRAIDYATNNGAHIINLSFMNLSYSKSMQAVIERANKAGVMVVAAAGNDQNGHGYNTEDTSIYPACYDGPLIGENMVIGVAATDALDQKTNFSSYGDRCIDISAPGISFFSTIAKGGDKNNPNLLYDGYFSGTSMAAPQVSATLALIAQINPELSTNEIATILFASVDNINELNPAYVNQLGNGRLNVNKAVKLARKKLYSRFGSLIVVPDKRNDYLENKDLPSPELRTGTGTYLNKLEKEVFDNYSSFSSADLNDDGEEEIIMGKSEGSEPRVKVITKEGKEKFSFLAYTEDVKSGIIVEVADILGDDSLEIIVSTKKEGNGRIKIFKNNGELITEIPAYDRNYKGELSLSAGNIDGEGKDEIVIGLASDLRIIDGEGKLIGAFYPYGKDLKTGFEVRVDNLDGRKNASKDEIIVVPKEGERAVVKIFDNYANLLNRFLAFGTNWSYGVNITSGDINNDGIAEIILGVKSGGAPHVRVFSLEGRILESFYVWDKDVSSGVNVLEIKI